MKECLSCAWLERPNGRVLVLTVLPRTSCGPVICLRMDRPTIERQISDHRRNLKELRLRRAALECQIDRTVKLLNDAEAALRELAEAGG